MSTSVVGLIGRVTGRIGTGLLGEVVLAVRGGTSAYRALPVDPDQRLIAVGEQVLVLEYAAPRTVWVAPLG